MSKCWHPTHSFFCRLAVTSGPAANLPQASGLGASSCSCPVPPRFVLSGVPRPVTASSATCSCQSLHWLVRALRRGQHLGREWQRQMQAALAACFSDSAASAGCRVQGANQGQRGRVEREGESKTHVHAPKSGRAVGQFVGRSERGKRGMRGKRGLRGSEGGELGCGRRDAWHSLASALDESSAACGEACWQGAERCSTPRAWAGAGAARRQRAQPAGRLRVAGARAMAPRGRAPGGAPLWHRSGPLAHPSPAPSSCRFPPTPLGSHRHRRPHPSTHPSAPCRVHGAEPAAPGADSYLGHRGRANLEPLGLVAGPRPA